MNGIRRRSVAWLTTVRGPAHAAAWRRAAVLCCLAAPLLGCGEEDPFQDVRPNVREGGGRIWEVSAEELPGAFDVFNGRRLFLGGGGVADSGDVFLDGPPGSTELRLRSVASLLRAEPAHQVEVQDVGPIDFGALFEIPEEGYVEASDTVGVAVVAGHVYALRIRRTELGPNAAKLVVDVVGATGEDLDRQFIEFRFAVQTQPGNPRFEEDE